MEGRAVSDILKVPVRGVARADTWVPVDPIDAIDWPHHAAGMYVEHNPHLANYETIEEWSARLDWIDWASDDERAMAISNNSLWTLQWYPDTPVGCHAVCASTLSACLKAAAQTA